MSIHWNKTTGALILSCTALLLSTASAHAQCKPGQQRQQTSTQQQLLQQLQRLNTPTGMQQQQNALISALQRQQQVALLTALQQRLQQNRLLLALQTKQQNGLLTATQNQQLADALQAARQQTELLLTALQQQNASANQNAWLDALQRQLSTLSDLSEQYSQQTSS